MVLHDQHVHAANVASWEAGFALGHLAYKLGVPYNRNANVAWQQGWKQGEDDERAQKLGDSDGRTLVILAT